MRCQLPCLLSSVEAEEQFARDRELISDVANGARAPARELACRGLHASHDAAEWVGVVHGVPRSRHHVLIAVDACPLVLKVETSVNGGQRRAIQDERAMVRDDRGQTSKVAFAMLFFPVRGTEDTIEVHQGWGVLLVRPRVTSAIEVDFLFFDDQGRLP